ncbi:MAG: 7-cyano-7-deazaguanine synthase QueC [Deltaproteobacteria bacterium]|nr:MAG: 7-cyano-7-deazaguanine synthase QueC [Deltaproteobacteria bacterium]
MTPKHAVVVHSGGMDSSICLAVAIREFGAEHVLSMSFRYGQRHSVELQRAQEICEKWGVDHTVVPITCLAEVTVNALTDSSIAIQHALGSPPNTLVQGRNGLMARVAGIHANHLGAHCIYMGVIEIESANSGYRDCSRAYMDLMQQILRMDFGDSEFEIRTPVVAMTKVDTLELAAEHGVLEYLLDRTITCYEGIPHAGCRSCPACLLRNEGIREYADRHPTVELPFQA